VQTASAEQRPRVAANLWHAISVGAWLRRRTRISNYTPAGQELQLTGGDGAHVLIRVSGTVREPGLARLLKWDCHTQPNDSRRCRKTDRK